MPGLAGAPILVGRNHTSSFTLFKDVKKGTFHATKMLCRHDGMPVAWRVVGHCDVPQIVWCRKNKCCWNICRVPTVNEFVCMSWYKMKQQKIENRNGPFFGLNGKYMWQVINAWATPAPWSHWYTLNCAIRHYVTWEIVHIILMMKGLWCCLIKAI